MAFIVSKPEWPNERRLQLAGEEIYFPLQMGNDWATIRIGLRWAAYSTWHSGISVGSNNPTYFNYSKFGVAVCSGLKGYFCPTPDDVIAVTTQRITSSTTSMTTVVTNQTPWCLNTSSGGSGIWKQGTRNIFTSAVNGQGAIILNQQATRLNNFSVAYFDINRSTVGTIAYRIYLPTAAQLVTQPNWTLANFYEGMGVNGTVTNTTSVVSGNTNYTTLTAAYTGSNVFNTMTIYSNHTANLVLDIATVAVCRYA